MKWEDVYLIPKALKLLLDIPDSESSKNFTDSFQNIEMNVSNKLLLLTTTWEGGGFKLLALDSLKS